MRIGTSLSSLEQTVAVLAPGKNKHYSFTHKYRTQRLTKDYYSHYILQYLLSRPDVTGMDDQKIKTAAAPWAHLCYLVMELENRVGSEFQFERMTRVLGLQIYTQTINF